MVGADAQCEEARNGLQRELHCRNAPPPRLLHGPYETPHAYVGARVVCRVRGRVTIAGLSTGRIPWPLGRLKGRSELIVYGALESALRKEAAVAICHWFGVSGLVVKEWRKRLGVEHTEGTIAVISDHCKEAWCWRETAWTEADDTILREFPPAEAATRLGRTRGAVNLRRHKLGIVKARGPYRCASKTKKIAGTEVNSVQP